MPSFTRMLRSNTASMAAGAIALCNGAPAAVRNIDQGPIDRGFDYHSYANVDQFRATHLELDLRVDVEHKTLTGIAALQFKRIDPRATWLVLDTKNLRINDVMQKATDVLGATAKSQTIWVSRPFHLEKSDPILGSALVIELPPSKRDVESIRIDYDTTEESSALQWLAPKQTAGRKRGFMYTQSEPIGTRSWIPLQDTPQVRLTYKADVHTSSDVRAVMSAENDPKAKRNGEYHFVMTQAIPSYLIALAVGDLEFIATGPRTGVYAEKSTLKAAAKEFADTESMLQTAESLFGPYRWERYDILVMPPSFPVGGMENPQLSFVTPTIITGDKSLVSVVAHELAHAWSGNLVGNATWRDLWLNEGFSDFLQSRIIAALYGADRAAMEEVLGVEALRKDFALLPPQDQMLAIDLRDRDPGLAFSEVPYEKGRLFLNFLEAKFGREKFAAFLKSYFEHYQFKSISTEQFLDFLKANLSDRNPGVVTAAQIQAWVSGVGLPSDAVLPATTSFAAVDDARSAWLAGRLQPKQVGAGWSTQQWLRFLDALPPQLTATQLSGLDQAHALSTGGNAQIASSWFALVIAANYQPSFPQLEAYLKRIGRLKLIEPLYQQLMQTSAGAEFAKRVYTAARPGYHPDAAEKIDAIVKASSDSSDSSDSSE